MSRKFSNIIEKESEWGSETSFVTSMNVFIPFKLQLICNKIAKQVGDNEFSIFCKIDRIEKNNIYLSDYYTIPEQRVSHASIDYGNDPKEPVDVVIHRHPDGLNKFSGVDDSFINKNFKCSILYTKLGGFVYGIYNLNLDENTKLRIETVPIVDDGLSDIDISNIAYFDSTIPNYLYEENFPENRFRDFLKYGSEAPSTIYDYDDKGTERRFLGDQRYSFAQLKEKWAREDAKKKSKREKKITTPFKISKDEDSYLFNINNEINDLIPDEDDKKNLSIEDLIEIKASDKDFLKK